MSNLIRKFLFIIFETILYFCVLYALLSNLFMLYQLVVDWGVPHEIILHCKGIELIPHSGIEYSGSPSPIFPVAFFVNGYAIIVWRFLVENFDLDLSRGSFSWLIYFILFYMLGIILLFILTLYNNSPLVTSVLIYNDLSLSLSPESE